MNAQELIQLKINAQQDIDAIEYGMRALHGVKLRGSYARKRFEGSPECMAAQKAAAREAAKRHGYQYEYQLPNAKRAVRAKLKDINAALKADYTARQIKMELAP